MCPTAIGDRRRDALGVERSRPESVRSHTSGVILQSSSEEGPISSGAAGASKVRTYVLAENQLVREALCRVLGRHEKISVVGGQTEAASELGGLAKNSVGVLVLVSRERPQADLEQIAAVREQAPALRILLIGSAQDDAEFLQYVRAGISGYLWRDASSEDVVRAIENVHAERRSVRVNFARRFSGFLRMRSRGYLSGVRRSVWGLRGGSSRLFR